jgi:hypothetical protein
VHEKVKRRCVRLARFDCAVITAHTKDTYGYLVKSGGAGDVCGDWGSRETLVSMESASPHRSHHNHRIGIRHGGHSVRLTAWFCCPCVVKPPVCMNLTCRTPSRRDYVKVTARLRKLHTDGSTEVIATGTTIVLRNDYLLEDNQQ